MSRMTPGCSIQHPSPRPTMAGFTMLELMIGIAIMAILISVGVPSFTTFYSNQRLIGAAEQLYNHLQQARTEAVGRNTMIYVNFSASGTTTWSYGMSHINGCDLTQTAATGTNACRLVVSDGDSTLDAGAGATDTGDLVLNRFTSADYSDVIVGLGTFGSGTQIAFSPLRGTATTGIVNLTSATGRKLRVQVSALGRPKICTINTVAEKVQGYPSC